MTDHTVDPASTQPAEDVATLRARLEDLQERNAAIEATSAPPHRALATLRAVAVVVLISLGAVLATAAVPTIWARNLVLNTDRYVQTLQPLANDPGVQNAVVKAVEQQFNRNVDVAAIVAQTLPPRAASTLGGPLQAGASSLVESVTTKFVQSQLFQKLWEAVNRAAHTSLVAVLTGRHSENAAVAVKDGVLYLNLAPIISEVKVRLVDAGLGIAKNVPAVGATVELLEVKGLTHAQSTVRTLDDAAVWLPVLALLCFAGAIALSTRRRRTTMASMLVIAGGMVLLAIGIAIGRRVYLDSLPLKYLTADDAGSVFDTLVRYLRDGLRIVFLVALLICAVLWITSGADRARATRARVSKTVRAVSASRADSPAVRVVAGKRRAVCRVPLSPAPPGPA